MRYALQPARAYTTQQLHRPSHGPHLKKRQLTLVCHVVQHEHGAGKVELAVVAVVRLQGAGKGEK